MNNQWQVKIRENSYMLGKDMYIFRLTPRGREILNKDGTITDYENGMAIPLEPFMHLEQDMLQGLADALNENGIKPQQGFIEGKLEATEKHLEDMRRLVFKKTLQNKPLT